MLKMRSCFLLVQKYSPFCAQAASGTNLIEATHVVLLDPVSGSKNEAKAFESQAIGTYAVCALSMRVCMYDYHIAVRMHVCKCVVFVRL